MTRAEGGERGLGDAEKWVEGAGGGGPAWPSRSSCTWPTPRARPGTTLDSASLAALSCLLDAGTVVASEQNDRLVPETEAVHCRQDPAHLGIHEAHGRVVASDDPLLQEAPLKCVISVDFGN